MSEMEYVMHNEQEQATPRSHQSPSLSSCPYIRGEHHQGHVPNPLPPPNPSMGMSPSRSHYDPVHPIQSSSWFPQPPFWSSQAIQQHHPMHQPRQSMPEPFFGNGLGLPGPMAGVIPGPPNMHSMHDPFAPNGPAWSYTRPFGQMPQPQPIGDAPRFGTAMMPQQPPSQMGHAHQANNRLERSLAQPAAPRSVPGVNLAQTLPPPSVGQNATSSADTSPASSGRPYTHFALSESPTRGPGRSGIAVAGTRPPPSLPPTASTPHPRPLPPPTRAMADFGASRLPEPPSAPATPPVPPNTERRRAAGRRRSASRLPTQPSDPESDDELEGLEEEEQLRLMAQYWSPGAPPFPVRVNDMEDRVRQHQLIRGGISTRRVASKSAISSMQSVQIADLPEHERMCIICYNDFGTPTPEGINEAPLRLPRCKHIFGDHCIKKWFEESDSCPYCRDKVPSEPQIRANSHAMREFIRTQRDRGLRPVPPTMSVEQMRTLQQLRAQQMAAEEAALGPRGWQTGERRSPPEEHYETRRRTRPRHGSFRGMAPSSSAPGNNNARPNSFAGASSSPPRAPPQPQHPQQQPPPMDLFSQGYAQPPMFRQLLDTSPGGSMSGMPPMSGPASFGNQPRDLPAMSAMPSMPPMSTMPPMSPAGEPPVFGSMNSATPPPADYRVNLFSSAAVPSPFAFAQQLPPQATAPQGGQRMLQLQRQQQQQQTQGGPRALEPQDAMDGVMAVSPPLPGSGAAPPSLSAAAGVGPNGNASAAAAAGQMWHP